LRRTLQGSVHLSAIFYNRPIFINADTNLNLRKNTILLHHALVNNPIGNPFVELLSVDSTNNYAMQMVHKGNAKHGTVYFAYQQFAGKGQRGKQWQTQSGENITMSVVLDTSSLQVSNLFSLSIAIALGVYDFFSAFVHENVFIKWPNDLYCGDRKAGGILIENIIRGKHWQNAIAGIGININQTHFDPSVINAISLKQITGKVYDPVHLANELCEFLEKRFRQLLNERSEILLEQYNSVLYKCGELVKFKKDNIVFEGQVKEVNLNGQLVIDAGAEQVYDIGEIEWLIN
jgi:BirA family biotin operon repressor/biotin-[acetyl-CoA-carboxylase] ligase